MLFVVQAAIAVRIEYSKAQHEESSLSLSHLLEGGPALDEVYRGKHDSGLATPVAIDPTLGQDVPFPMELFTDLTAKPRVQRCQVYSSCEVSWRSCEIVECLVVQLQRSICQLSLVEGFEVGTQYP